MLHLVLNGIAVGCVYSLLALALGVIYSTTGIINFAHGELVMLGAMFGLVFIAGPHLPYAAGVAAVVVLVALAGVILHKTSIAPLGDLSGYNVGWIITTLGAGIILRNMAQIVWGTEPRSFPYLFGGRYGSILGHKFLLHEAGMVVVSLLVAVALEWMMQGTIWGKAIRAVATNPEAARLMGIPVRRVVGLCFGLSGAVAGVAGVLIAPITFASSEMTVTIALKGFAAAVIGGIGSSRGAFVGGLLIGLLEGLLADLISPGLKDAISFLIMIVVLQILPGGIMGVGSARVS